MRKWVPVRVGVSVQATTRTGTLLRMEQSGFRPDQPQAYGGAKHGWQKFFENLEQSLAKAE